MEDKILKAIEVVVNKFPDSSAMIKYYAYYKFIEILESIITLFSLLFGLFWFCYLCFWIYKKYLKIQHEKNLEFVDERINKLESLISESKPYISNLEEKRALLRRFESEVHSNVVTNLKVENEKFKDNLFKLLRNYVNEKLANGE